MFHIIVKEQEDTQALLDHEGTGQEMSDDKKRINSKNEGQNDQTQDIDNLDETIEHYKRTIDDLNAKLQEDELIKRDVTDKHLMQINDLKQSVRVKENLHIMELEKSAELQVQHDNTLQKMQDELYNLQKANDKWSLELTEAMKLMKTLVENDEVTMDQMTDSFKEQQTAEHLKESDEAIRPDDDANKDKNIGEENAMDRLHELIAKLQSEADLRKERMASQQEENERLETALKTQQQQLDLATEEKNKVRHLIFRNLKCQF